MPQQKNYSPKDEVPKYIIIDGQQRLISLSLGFRNWVKDDKVRLWD